MRKIIFSLILFSIFIIIKGHKLFPDYKNHPCIRPCSSKTRMTCEYNFTIEYYYTLTKACLDCPFNKTDCERPQCVPADGTSRGLITVNKMLPGPGIHVCLNDIIVVNVNNRLEGSEGTTIHWHGIHQRYSQYMDGVPMLTQCPILPYSSFQYRFKAETPGTHFWHAHSGLQRSDGMFGQLVVRSPPEQEPNVGLYDVDTPEYTIVINDWLTEMSVNKFTKHYMAGGDNKPASMLINGKGAFRKFRTTNGSTINTPLETFTIKNGLRYRFRLISNGIMYCPKQFSIDHHNLTLIATDGSPVEPLEVESVNILNGERYDVIMHANQPNGTYWLRVRGDADCSVKKASQLAIVRYEGSKDEIPSEQTDYDSGYRKGREINPTNKKETDDLIPVSLLESKLDDDDALKDIPDKKFYLTMDFYSVNNYRYQEPPNHPVSVLSNKHTYVPQINHISTILPPSPVLTQYKDIPEELFCNEEKLKNITDCSKTFCECVHVLKVSLGDVVELILIDEGNTYDANHPMHLHGNYFRVIGMEKLNSSTTLDEVKRLDSMGLLKRNLTKRVAKDTVNVPDGGYTVVRFHATNPGFWFFHCHIDFHAEVGMGLVFQVGEVHEHHKVPYDFPRCGSWKFTGY